MTDTQSLLDEINRFLASGAMAESTFGRKAVNDGKLVARLRRGGSVTLESASRIRSFMATANNARGLSRPAEGATA
ncbi:MAG: hypothetical protein WDN46_10185 [Methylocella sp.]